ncbi:sensor domain-containing diguanylate cyclase [Vibrio sp. 10N]|uniref:sensor domain-containing diguanylate cyclase n=1 Tax=Vibrio sp. 10N TaxID=3058938 RepID=UPI002813FE06|nr:sensor domain-containing diguanylate cyclase [Vibrio sp. 10N]
MLIMTRFNVLWSLALILVLICRVAVASDETDSQNLNVYDVRSQVDLPFSENRLIVTNSKAWKPYSFIDDTGQPAGILVDFWKAYGQVNNVEIEFQLVDWKESLDRVKRNQADIHAGLLWSEARSGYLAYGRTLFQIDTQLYFHHSLQTFDANAFLQGNHNHNVGVVNGGYEAEYMQTHYPNVALTYFANNALMIEAALGNRIRAFVADLQVANYYLTTSRASGQFIDVKHLYSGNLYYATSIQRAQALGSVIARFNKVTAQERERILNRWMYIATVYPDYLPKLAVGIIVALVASYLLVFKFALKLRTAELARSNQRLKHLSETDALTGLWNRRYFLEKLQRYGQLKGNLTVMIVDIDNFKAINDTYGHVKGDLVIKSVAEKLSSLTGQSQTIARIGGEEFALAFVDQITCASEQLAKNICDAVREIELAEIDYQRVTVSVGCVIYQSAGDFETLYEADKLMYAAKKQGKNQAVIDYLPSKIPVAQPIK